MTKHYTLRPEQHDAVTKTLAYWKSHHDGKFLWNAKPRFGKTLAAYDFAKRIQAQRILIITNRPAISDSWRRDYEEFLCDTDYFFTNSRAKITSDEALLKRPLIFFISLQDIRGKTADSQDFKTKNQWIFQMPTPWDLLIIDEGHEAAWTKKSLTVFQNIPTHFRLYLSGTPFRILANNYFADDQIFNWTYVDEQKTHHESPRFQFYLVSPAEKHAHGIKQHSPNLNHRALKFPELNDKFSQLTHIFQKHTKDQSLSFRHSFWLLPGVAECRAMQKLLAEHPFFHDYQIILAAGKNNNYYAPKNLLATLRAAIGNDPLKTKTITLSCGQLSTGITVPEWTAVVMLTSPTDLSRISSTLYLQAAFRAQNPHTKYRKTKSFVVDFYPERALTILRDYAENLCAKSSKNLNSILASINQTAAFSDLLDYCDIFSVTNEQIQKLSAAEALELPRQFAAQEVVNSKFASDRLFNFQKLFTAPADIRNLVNHLSPIRQINPHHHTEHQELQNLSAFSASELRERARQSPHKRYEDELSFYRAKLRLLSRPLPLLFHIYGTTERLSRTFRELLAFIPDLDFTELTNFPKSIYLQLLDAGIIDEHFCIFALNEFIKHEITAQNYYHTQTPDYIFNYIPNYNKSRILTPMQTAAKMVDNLARQNPALFRNPEITFFDPSARSGIFLAEIIRKLYQAQRPNFPNGASCLQHILKHQIYAWTPTRAFRTSVLKTISGGLNLKNYDNIFTYDLTKGTTNARDFIQELWGSNMKINIIIGNPPFQDGRRQVYADFYKLAVDLNPDLLCMVFPQGWQKPYNHNGLGQLNNATYKRDQHLVSIDNYAGRDAEQLFPELGTGGVNIVLRDRSYNNHGQIQNLQNGQPAGVIQLPLTNNELQKPAILLDLLPQLEPLPKVSALGSARKPYGFYADPLRHPEKYHLKLQDQKQRDDDVRLFGLFTNTTRGSKYIPHTSLPKQSPNLATYKLFVPKAWGNMSDKIGLGGSYANICVASPGDACSETFLEFGPFATKDEASKMAKYFMTQFFRALLFLAKDSQNTARDKYRYIPLLDLNERIWQRPIPEIDAWLFQKFHVPPETQNFIRQNIQPRSEANIEVL